MPELSKNQIEGLQRTFLLYCKSPKIFYPLIRFLERKGYLSNLFFKIYNLLIWYRWSIFAAICRKLVRKIKGAKLNKN